MPAVLGRVGADVTLRGASVSRRHAEVELADGDVVVRDLDSRNGTLVRGLAIAGEVKLSGGTALGLGDDVTVRVTPIGPEAVRLDVDKGLDRGTVVLIGGGTLRLPDAPGLLSFPEGRATLTADDGVVLLLGTQECALPILLLDDDHVSLGAHRIEVRK